MQQLPRNAETAELFIDPREERRQLLAERRESSKERDLDRRQKRQDKRRQAY